MLAGISRAAIFSNNVMRRKLRGERRIVKSEWYWPGRFPCLSRFTPFSRHDQPAWLRRVLARNTAAEKLQNLIAELFTTRTPAPCAGQLFHASAQPGKTNQFGRPLKFLAHLFPEAGVESKLEHFARFIGQAAQVSFLDGCWFWGLDARDVEAEPAHGSFQCSREFTQSNRRALKFVMKIMQHRGGGVLHYFAIEMLDRRAHQFNGHRRSRTGNVISIAHFKHQAVGS